MTPDETPDEHDGVLYDSPRTSLAWKVVVSLATGLALAEFMSFWRWFERASPLGALPPPTVALGACVAALIVASALRSRVVRRVEVSPDRPVLKVYRDPGVVDELPLASIASVTSELPEGGWSRDPAELLVLTLRDGSARRYELPDDADTPGIVRDLMLRV